LAHFSGSNKGLPNPGKYKKDVSLIGHF
jgi:hypothetical protein